MREKIFKLDVFNQELKLAQSEIEGFEIVINAQKLNCGYSITRTIKNVTNKELKLREIKATLSGIDFRKDREQDYFYSNENARIFCNLTMPVGYDRKDDDNPKNLAYNVKVNRKWNDPDVKGGRICGSPYQPFPALLISNYQVSCGVVVGSLSQDVFFHSYEIYHHNKGLCLEIYASFKGVEYREVAPKEQLIDVFYVGEEKADDINAVFAEYSKVLRTYLADNKRRKETNRHSLIWDSWNDGIYRNVSEKMLIKEAKAVKELFPTVEWFQLDDGYASYCEENVDLDAHGLGVPYEGENGVDKIKFPNGLKGYTDKVKQIGLKPSIWVGGFCPVKTKIYKDHPEWFIDYTYRVNWTQPLDVSKKDVRDYMTYAIETMLKGYGFEGIKHDFWSYAFEDSHDLLFNKDKSGYEHRDWWLKEIRKRLPEYGYMQTGCDLAMGNPFLAKYFNNYRFGLDVGGGNWENIKTTMFWCVAMLSTHTGDLFIPNSDSAGLLPGLNDVDFMFVINFQVITRTLVELSGRFSLVDLENKRLKVLQRATSYLNNGEDVFFAKYDYRRRGEILPEIIYINSPCFANEENSNDIIKTVAIFNPEERKKDIIFSLEDLGLTYGEYVFTEVWDNSNVTVKKGVSICLDAHESKLYVVKKRKI